MTRAETHQGQTFVEGDLVKVYNPHDDQETYQATLRGNQFGALVLGGTGTRLGSFLSEGFRAEIVESAAKRLPTEPGVYESDSGWRFLLSIRGDWWNITVLPSQMAGVGLVREHLPLYHLSRKETE